MPAVAREREREKLVGKRREASLKPSQMFDGEQGSLAVMGFNSQMKVLGLIPDACSHP